MDNETILLTVFFVVVVLFYVQQRYSLRHYNIRTEGLPEGVIVRSFCKGRDLIHIVSDGEGYSRPVVKETNSPACGGTR